MSVQSFFAKAAIYPTALAFILLGGKGCITGLVADDDQKDMDYVGRVTDNIIGDLASIAKSIFKNAKERTPEEIKEAGRALSDSVKDIRKDIDDRRYMREQEEALRATARGELGND